MESEHRKVFPLSCSQALFMATGEKAVMERTRSTLAREELGQQRSELKSHLCYFLAVPPHASYRTSQFLISPCLYNSNKNNTYVVGLF